MWTLSRTKARDSTNVSVFKSSLLITFSSSDTFPRDQAEVVDLSDAAVCDLNEQRPPDEGSPGHLTNNCFPASQISPHPFLDVVPPRGHCPARPAFESRTRNQKSLVKPPKTSHVTDENVSQMSGGIKRCRAPLTSRTSLPAPGIGYASIVIVSLLNIYYIVILAWGLYYLFQVR